MNTPCHYDFTNGHNPTPSPRPTAALLVMFFLESNDMLSGGALGALTVGLVACYMWERGAPRCGSSGPNTAYAPDIERVVAKVRGASPCFNGTAFF